VEGVGEVKMLLKTVIEKIVEQRHEEALAED